MKEVPPRPGGGPKHPGERLSMQNWEAEAHLPLRAELIATCGPLPRLSRSGGGILRALNPGPEDGPATDSGLGEIPRC